MGFALHARKVGGSWVCWEGKRERKMRGKFWGCEGAKRRMGMGSVFGTGIISQLARENRGSGLLRPSRTQGKFWFGKKGELKHQKLAGGQARRASPKEAQGGIAGRWEAERVERRGPRPRKRSRWEETGNTTNKNHQRQIPCNAG